MPEAYEEFNASLCRALDAGLAYREAAFSARSFCRKCGFDYPGKGAFAHTPSVCRPVAVYRCTTHRPAARLGALASDWHLDDRQTWK